MSWTKVDFLVKLSFVIVVIVVFSETMYRLHQIAKWICIFCFEERDSVTFDWAVLRCDHLVCLRCFRQRAEELKTLFQRPCGCRFPESAYHYIVNFTAMGCAEAEKM